MAKSAKTNAARQVELVIRRLNSLSTLPEVAAGFLAHLVSGSFSVAALSDIVESDPALTARIFRLAHAEGVVFADGKPNIAEAIAKLPASTVRDAILSVTVFQAFDADYDPDAKRPLPRKDLALHALAVACCAKHIADFTLPEADRPMAFSAGLLHDIGKLAIDEVMPKSFAIIAEEAKSQNQSFRTIEHEHLGIDHTVIGKRLAEKWSLPEEIKMAIWLHHSDTEVVATNMPGARIAAIVQLADMIARQCDIGQSGSFEAITSVDETAAALSLSPEQLQQIRSTLADRVAQRSQLLGLQAPGGPAAYCNLISQAASKLAHDNSELSTANRTLATGSALVDFVRHFMRDVGPDMAPIDVAAVFADGWRQHYQTGPVCVYLIDDPKGEFIEVVTIDDSSRTDTDFIETNGENIPIPPEIQNNFALLAAADYVDWLIEKLDFKCDISRTKLCPLITSGKAIGAVIFEQRLPDDPSGPSDRAELLAASASIGAGIIALARGRMHQGRLSEQFADLLGRLKNARDKITAVKSLTAIAEMAAGAGHELNNPLAVISGRAQLLVEGETDKKKKDILKQIQDRTNEMSDIVSDLMAFAQPKQPAPKTVAVKSLIEDAIKQTAKLHKIKKLQPELTAIGDLPEVYADPDQIVASLTGILSNALDSYEEAAGPITIDGSCPQPEGFATFTITDQGCGMDAETLAKATQPFFSARPAGRKRGMGLAHAQRLITLNKANMNLTSQPLKGTKATINLPKP
ncbi:MAG: HDOD domain-containing protein [Planctomycetes bacterium]|nr:HDOD domain-containing protein [Planctomycetota bacterium]